MYMISKEENRDYVTEYLENTNWLIKENANTYDSYTKLRGYIADNTIKSWALNNIYTKEIIAAHEAGFIYVHDLSDGVVPYCRGHDIRKILRKGLITHTVVGGRPKHYSSLFNQLVNMIGTAQQNWAGAQAISHINTLAAPFIRKDYGKYRDEDGNYPDWVKAQIRQVNQEFIYDLNFPSRAGSQTPFSNIILDFMCPGSMRNESVCNAGCEGTYGDYEVEARLILETFNDLFFEGDARGAPFTFPIVTINCIPETPYKSELWTKLIATTLKMGTYSFFNYDGSGIDPNSVESMCCRFAPDTSEIAQAGGRWAYGGETGSIGIVTVNMAKLGYLAETEEDILKMFTVSMNHAKNSLISKGLFIEQFQDRLMSFDKPYGINLTQFFRTIGIVGLNEMCINFNGKTIVDNVELVKRVMLHMRDWIRATQKETGLLWNAEQTPAESCSPKLARKDKEMYGDSIFAQGAEGTWYYTSMLTDPAEDITFGRRTEVEEEILPLFSGGTVYRMYIYDKRPSVEAMAKFVERMMKTKIPYTDLAITLTNCPTCKKSYPGAHEECPDCGGETEIYDRIVGYYRPRSRVNKGRLEEIKNRNVYEV
jgi:ribonucleoside-triphosphate reductase (formate)